MLLMYKISTEKPPGGVYEQCQAIFGSIVDMDRGTIFTYGDTIYAKSEMAQDVIEHELVHMRQQEAMGPDHWWQRYLEDPFFRLHEEIEAYQVQYDYILATKKDRNERFYYLNAFANFLSGATYGQLVSKAQARKLIQRLKP